MTTVSREVVPGPLSPTFEALATQGVSAENRIDVENYLLSHPQVGEALPQVAKQARHGVGTDGQLVLKIDRSAGAGNEWLVLLVRQRAYDEGIVSLTRELNEFARSLVGKDDWRFVVTTDFLPAA